MQGLLSGASLVILVIGCVLSCRGNAVESSGNFLAKHPPGTKASALRELFPTLLGKKVPQPILIITGFPFRPFEGAANNLRRRSIIAEQAAFIEEEGGDAWQACSSAHLRETAVGLRVNSCFDGWHN
jgi:hypothetical protein